MGATVKITKVEGDTDLFCWYEGEHRPQACRLSLSLETGEMTCEYNPAVGNAVSQSVFNRRILTFPILCLTNTSANLLMEEVAPIAQRVLDGASIEWDGNNHIGVLTDAANEACSELAEAIEEWHYGADEVSMLDADDFLGDEDLTEVLGLTADTTDDELTAVESAAEAVIRSGANNVVVVRGLERYLEEKRAEMREQAREELEGAAERYANLRETRDRLIRRVASWGVDSDRAIATIAGLSHTRVQSIVKAGMDS